MKHLLTLTVMALVLAAFATTTFAEGGCGSSEGGKKDKDKSEEGCAG